MSLDKNHLRIRNDPKIRPLNIEAKTLVIMEKIMSDPTSSPKVKHDIIKKMTGTSPCCNCVGIPSVELSHQVGTKEYPARILEYYCLKCLETVFEREKLEPTNKDELAEYYGCVIGSIYSTNHVHG
jgi:hypothetical protein